MHNKEFRLGIYYLPSNVTTQDYIQVRELQNGIESVIGSFERYDYVVEAKLKGDSFLNLVLKDTSLNAAVQDTFLIDLE